jgi:Flp pilus assembly protein TadB
MFQLLTLINSALIAAILIAGGWVKVRDYFHNKSASKAAALKEKAEQAEAQIQERIKAEVDRIKQEYAKDKAAEESKATV